MAKRSMREMALEKIVREYLAADNRCSSDTNANGTRCECGICRRARVALSGSRGAAFTLIDRCIEQLVDELSDKARP